MIDWSAYFPYTIGDLIIAAFTGVFALAPLLLVRVGYRWAADILQRILISVGLDGR
ncbi:hypothetical protein [Kallotenue papyrolyticum]|uniref:hypothetical protein n=1 Tax=Kallotenue papyrolyticum TaxID=1325125 RepID=UPI0004ACB1E2|nr:hypothetical protein [Kallotenue papyrolyticum]